MTEKNGKLNNAMRKALADVVEKKYSKLIEEAKSEFAILKNKAFEEACKKVGMPQIDDKIEELQKQKEKLRDKLYKQGWSRDGYLKSDYSGYGSATYYSDTPAFKSVKNLAKGKTVCELKKERSDVIAKIWLETEIKSAKDIIDKI